MIYNFFLWKPSGIWLQQRSKHWAKPATRLLISGFLSDLNRSRANLVVKNAVLHQQLIVLNRQVKRPELTSRDRFRLILLDYCTRFLKQAIHILHPYTLLR